MNRRLVAVAVAALAAAGCGSTLQGQGAVTAVGSGAQQGTGAASTSADAGLSAPGSQAGGGTVGAGAVGGVSANGSGGVDGSGAAAGSGPAGVSGPGSGVGVTRNAIYVGISYLTNGDAANAALGVASITTGDERADAKAVIDDINAHGGVAGRKLVAVWHAYNANSQDTSANQDQAACADYEQDHKSFAVLGTGYTDNFMQCVTRAGATVVDAGPIIAPDAATLRTFPYYYESSSPSQDRMMADEVTTLARMSYFSGWDYTLGRATTGRAKIGIISLDLPDWERPLQRVLLPALARAGQPVAATDIYRVHNPNSTAEDSVTVSDVQNATLKFRQDGVSHVIMLDANGSLTLLFANDARSQHYYPRLGVNSATGLQALYDSGVIQKGQLNGAVGLGWAPTLDLPASQGDRYGTAATKHCLQVMKQRTGQTYSSTNAAAVALSFCDELYLLRDAVNTAGPVVNRGTVRAAVERLQGRFVPAGAPASFFSPQRHDGIETGFDLTWDNGCTCVKYVGSHRIA